MSTFGTMQDRIGEELRRQELDVEIRRAIVSSLAFYKRKRYNFTLKRATLPTVAGQEYYQLPSDFIESDTVVLRSSGEELDFQEERTHHYIDRNKEWSGYKSRPDIFAVQTYELRLYPVPDRSYTILMSYVYELPDISASASDTATNAWMTEGEELIRTHAKIDMLINVIQSPESFQYAGVLKAQEKLVEKALDRQHKRAQSSGRLTPWS